MPTSDRMETFKEFKHRIGAPAEKQQPPAPVQAQPTLFQEFKDWLAFGLSEYEKMIDSISNSVLDSVFSLAGIGFAMAAVARFAPPHTAPVGVAAMFVIGAAVSTLYFVRTRREEHLQETVDELQRQLDERFAEIENAIAERLDVLVRNA
jgi:Flp pilus assembly protein TadB